MKIANKQKVHYCDPYFFSPRHPITITVIGAGGTGSFLISRLARLDFALRQLEHPGLHVKVYDGDIIEPHNVGRQNFTRNEIGLYKASTMIEKVNFAFGLDWEADNIMVKPKDVTNSNIIVTCVDNAAFRMQLNDLIMKNYKISNRLDYTTSFYWLDCGNGKDFGQVVLSTMGKIKQPKNSEFELISDLRTVVEVFGDLGTFDNIESQGIENCSFRESIERQDLFINDMISNLASDMLWKLLRYKYLTHHGVVLNQGTLQQRGLIIK
ncbi:PRTRC genetic system ThiF family protein [Flavobacterium chryseum]|uniref:PRTRC system ThiF family protein n=1 Tax=Flavobacterium sp. P3160 TaxID=2512113 RepID=UPI00105E5224|nr:PRTRC system ThiF family protein [Flavobacterium sp. P3160]TDO68768.1 PRTRC genetic system ThiF family protein [Flavobacterium sp. P3160]